MSDVVRNIFSPLGQLWAASGAQMSDWLLKEHHRFSITGLSRSGKSVLFTSLMTVLRYRCEEGYQSLPLLRYLPMELVESMRIDPLEGMSEFPLHAHLNALEQGDWPAPTESLYGFRLTVRLKEPGSFKKWFLPHRDIVFEFIDYPGEWVTDLPMLSKPFTQWSDSAWAQQSSEPQSLYSSHWHQVVREFDFDQPVTPDAINVLVNAYRRYLQTAKKNGIAMLQPGSFLISGSNFDWEKYGFTPLPSKVTSDVTHPWYQTFEKHYRHFCDNWLTPLREKTFKETDRQVILVDLFEGLNHSKQHLYQLKETLSHLAEVFAYGESSWWSKTLMNKERIGRVAFVGTKADLVPATEKPALLALLREITGGATARLKDKPVQFDHFLVSAIQATDKGKTENSLRYTDKEGQYHEAEFEPLPESIKAMAADEHYPILETGVPPDHLARLLNGRGLDRLFQYLLEGTSS